MYFLDTNTCIYFLNGKFASVRDKLLSVSSNDVMIPAIVKAELLLGACKSKKPADTRDKVERFLEPFEVAAFSDPVTYVYSEIRSKLEKAGKIIGPNDLIIASIVKFHEGILVTNDVMEFRRVKGLKVENWV